MNSCTFAFSKKSLNNWQLRGSRFGSRRYRTETAMQFINDLHSPGYPIHFWTRVGPRSYCHFHIYFELKMYFEAFTSVRGLVSCLKLPLFFRYSVVWNKILGTNYNCTLFSNQWSFSSLYWKFQNLGILKHFYVASGLQIKSWN